MAALPKSGTPSPCSPTPTREHTFAGWLAGEDIAAGDACQIAATGKIVRSNGAAATDAARIDGYAAGPAQNGEAATLQHDVHFHYGAGMTPGTPYYLSGTVPGGLDTVASIGGTVIVARAISATRLYVKKSW
jgi:hypothetical protein